LSSSEREAVGILYGLNGSEISSFLDETRTSLNPLDSTLDKYGQDFEGIIEQIDRPRKKHFHEVIEQRDKILIEIATDYQIDL
jgi:hypothetical protein